MRTQIGIITMLLVTGVASATCPFAQTPSVDPEWGDTMGVYIQTPIRNPSDWAVGLRSFGPIQYGMTVQEAEAASGVRFRVEPISEDGTCGFASIVGGPDFVSFMVQRGGAWRIKSVAISGSSDSGRLITRGRQRTVSGIGIGSTFAQVRRTYPGQIRVSPDIYGGPSGLMFMPRARADRGFVVLFDTEDGRAVSAISAGYSGWADAPEGCS